MGPQACRAEIITFWITREQVESEILGSPVSRVYGSEKGGFQVVVTGLGIWNWGNRVGDLEVGGQKGVKVWVRTPTRG